jgi:hypothetical protein
MYPDRAQLEQLFSRLSDEELVACGSSGELTDLAQEVAHAEAKVRGLGFKPTEPPDEPVTEPGIYHGDMQTVARHLTPTEAHMLVSFLRVAGIPAEAGDTNLVQANVLLSPAMGGACVRVPADSVAEANDLIAARKRGDFTLDVDFDAGGQG